MPRAERLAAAATALDDHARAVRDAGLTPGLVSAAQRAITVDPTADYVELPPFALSLRDLRFFCGWNAPSATSPAADREVDASRWAAQRAALADLASQLRERGIELLVVPIPRPLQIYPERLDAELAVGEPFVGVDPALTAMLSELVAAGVEVLHLTPHFARAREERAPDRDRFLYHDVNQHWTPRAVTLTADLIAARALQSDTLRPGPLTEGEAWNRVREQVPYKLPMYRRQPLTVPVWVDSIRRSGEPSADVRDRSSPVLLLGDSYCRWYELQQAALADQLLARLGRSLDVVAIPTSDPLGPWRTVLRREGAGQLGSKRLVVWIFDAAKLGQDDLVSIDLFEDPDR